MNLTYLLKDVYDPMFLKQVYESAEVSVAELGAQNDKEGEPLRLTYHNKAEYKKFTKQLGLMDDFRVSSVSFELIFALDWVVAGGNSD